MPPHVPRKRSLPPDNNRHVVKRPRKSAAETPPSANSPARKPTLWDDLDSASKRGSIEKTKAAIQQMQEDEDDSTSLSSLSDAQFEDVPGFKRQETTHNLDDSDEDDEDIEFEDVPSHEQPNQPELEMGDLELTLYQDNRVLPLASELGKKGPSKREKAIRVATHCIHVQFLLWHNAVRNSWLCDPEVQAVLLSHLPPRLWEEVDRWKHSSGLEATENECKAKKSTKLTAKQKPRSKRDWSEAADHLEKGVPDLSHGDPLFRLLKCLIAWWKQRFAIITPGLRKWGYMDARRLGKLRTAFEKEENNPAKFGERVENLAKFRQLAQDCTGSRDIGAQLFTALLRGLGLNARMVANIQPLGFGWSKAEEADEVIEQQRNGHQAKEPAAKTRTAKKKGATIRLARRQTRKSDRDALRIDIDDSDEFAEPLSESEGDASVVDITDDVRPKQTKLHDKDLEFPHYWTEVLSPVTNKYIAVDPIVKSIIGTNRELVESLEPRGGKADKAKQIMAYCVGFSHDGTAKDVTVRYLKKQIFPGKTKGIRMPEEKVPIYNKHGKIRRYDQFNWFKSIMSGYSRGDKKYPITALDELEDSTDLKPAQPQKKEMKEGEETLQYYKTSKEYVLQRHLKREEALLPNALPVKIFRNKGKGGKVEEEDVYLRRDVVSVKSAETWHKQGRAPIDGAQPLKHAPYRAATTNRRREIAEAEAATGQKVLQPLYSFDQTDWIIPDPIKNGVIPKNEYGNIDMFAEHMCPEGAVHVPYRGLPRVCKRLGVDFAEAVVGFEFGHRMAVPVIQGVVIAQEYYDRVLEELEKEEAERARKEDEKRRKAALGTWRRFLMGLRIADRIRQEYGHLDETIDVLDSGNESQRNVENGMHDDDFGGGFLPEGYEEDEPEKEEPRQTSSFFNASVTHDDEDDEGEDPFQVEYDKERIDPEPVEARDDDSHNRLDEAPARRRGGANPKTKFKPQQSTRRRTRRKKVESSDEDQDAGDEEFKLSDDDD
ncbi:Rad4 transglutaminase-like domain-containing protein [Xylaria bambusicola]|uniref:Rad4 transglutaminase-like domain-containing protein n=1 Tax=Xylaria bambusicola TaxID=326684 RepID=UPI00200839C5|nr:Rad4 transglutaminase-like domain-containing protein [Xylaria bambusicola]KAI0515304.1 Rad4 transglutaminase-like domain-containing protein [Xylaria bambusicola]